ncbi:MAG: LPS-assembly protein LptD [Candidatus Omnitrophica bacterium]|nr:LPS-assembly protein LptD [Candidatus Omnitrophota bacterium]
MKKLFAVFAIIVLLSLPFSISLVFSQKTSIPVIVEGDQVSYLQQEGKVVAKGNVVLKYKEVVITCEEAVYEVEKSTTLLKGNVKITSEKGVVFADSASYNFLKKEVETKNIRIESPPIYGNAELGEGIYQNKYILHNGFVTTCDLKNPHYCLTAKKITVYPGKRVVAKNVALRIGKLPVFYLPYYSQSIKDKSFPLQVSPGKSKEWGFYVLTRWRYYLSEENKGRIHFDWYQKRGEAAGVTYKSKSGDFGESLFKFYSIQDKLYREQEREEFFDIYPERESILPKYLEDDRYKAQFFYSWRPTSNLSIKSEFHKFSDRYFMRDFFYREYEIQPHPLSYTLADLAFHHSSLSLLIQKRVNHFYTETEYLPKLEYNIFKQRVSTTYPFYIKSQISLANLSKKNANSDEDDDALRFHSHNVLSYETKLAWLNINPYIGHFATYYSKNIFGKENVLRNALETGISLSTNLYKIFNREFSLFGERVSKLRQVVTPILTYIYIHPPTVVKSHIFQFDSIDDLERKESIVFKLDNRFQAKNSSRQWDFLYFSPSLEYKINEEGRGSYFDNVKMDLEFNPTQRLSLDTESNYDCRDRAFKEVNVDLNFQDKDKKYAFSFGHRYARKESSQSTFSLTCQLTPKLQFKNYLRYEYKTGDFKEQQYILRRDLHCWWMDLGVDVDREKNITIWVIFRVKAFPKVHIGFEHTYHGAKKSY